MTLTTKKTIGLSIFFSMLIANPVLAETVLLQENFDTVADGKLPEGWEPFNGNWSVIDGKLRGTPHADAKWTTIHFGDPTWRNVALEAEVTLIEAHQQRPWFALLVRDGGKINPGVQLTSHQISPMFNRLEIMKKKPAPNRGWHFFQNARAPGHLRKNEAHRLRIEASGHWISGFWDGRQILRTPRGNEVSPVGRVGLRVGRATVLVDNVKVLQLDPPLAPKSRLPRTRPLVIAHRGFSWQAPENTLAAYRQAIEAGAPMAECDVRLSADRVPVVLHDEDLERITGVKNKVGDLTLAELKKLDAGKWKSQKYAGESIPTLEELLKLVKGKLRLVIEIKEGGIEKEVLQVMRTAKVKPDEVMIFSFHRSVVETIARLEPLLPTTWLIGELPYQKQERREVIRRALKVRVSAIGLNIQHVDPDFVQLAHECGLQVFVWTVNDPADMHFLNHIGIDAIITNRPDVLLNLLEQN